MSPILISFSSCSSESFMARCFRAPGSASLRRVTAVAIKMSKLIYLARCFRAPGFASLRRVTAVAIKMSKLIFMARCFRANKQRRGPLLTVYLLFSQL